MNRTAIKRSTKAMTLLKVLVVIVVVFVFAALFFPPHRGRSQVFQVVCASNLRQLGTAFNMFAMDHSTNFPWQVSVTNGGSIELVSSGSPAPHFQTLSNYLHDNWRVLSCPADRSRR